MESHIFEEFWHFTTRENGAVLGCLGRGLCALIGCWGRSKKFRQWRKKVSERFTITAKKITEVF